MPPPFPLIHRLLCLLWLGLCVHGHDLSAQFEAANRLYEQGRFGEAVTAYQALLDQGHVSPAIEFNLGNAAFKAGQLGQAIFHYRQAERLAPRDPDIRANLGLARDAVPGTATLTPPAYRRWLARLSLDEWTLLAAAATWLWLSLLALGQLRPQSRPALRGCTGAAGILAGLVGLGLGLTWRDVAQTTWAIVTQPDATLRHGPLDESPSLQSLHDGQELLVVDRKEPWLQVTGAARGSGWIRQDHVHLLGP